MSHRSLLTSALAEMEENRRRFDAYLRELKEVIIATFDDHTGALADWDWQWPQHEPLATTFDVWLRARKRAPLEVRSCIDGIYASLASMPPPLHRWIERWDGNVVTVLPFLTAELEDAAAALTREFGNCENFLRRATDLP